MAEEHKLKEEREDLISGLITDNSDLSTKTNLCSTTSITLPLAVYPPRLRHRNRCPPVSSLSAMAEESSPLPATMSPVSQLLSRLGMTRDDLSRHSDQMRQFLVADGSALTHRHDRALTPLSIKRHSHSRSSTSVDASVPSRHDPLPATPVKSEPVELSLSGRKLDAMETVIELQNATRRGKRRYEDEDEAETFSSPDSTSLSASRRDSKARSRVSRRDSLPYNRIASRYLTSGVRNHVL